MSHLPTSLYLYLKMNNLLCTQPCEIFSDDFGRVIIHLEGNKNNENEVDGIILNIIQPKLHHRYTYQNGKWYSDSEIDPVTGEGFLGGNIKFVYNGGLSDEECAIRTSDKCQEHINILKKYISASSRKNLLKIK